MNFQVEGLKGELEEGMGGVGGVNFDLSWCTRVRRYFDGEGSRRIIFQESGMDEVVLLRFAVPEEAGGFLAVGAFYCLGLEGGGIFAVESVFDS